MKLGILRSSWGHWQSVKYFYGRRSVSTLQESVVAFVSFLHLGFVLLRILQFHLGFWLVAMVHRIDWTCLVHRDLESYNGTRQIFQGLSLGLISPSGMWHCWFVQSWEWATEIRVQFSNSISVFNGEVLGRQAYFVTYREYMGNPRLIGILCHFPFCLTIRSCSNLVVSCMVSMNDFAVGLFEKWPSGGINLWWIP